jgi:hypothetical protein
MSFLIYGFYVHFSGTKRGHKTKAGCNNLADSVLIPIGIYSNWNNNSEARKYNVWKECEMFNVKPKNYKNVPLGFKGLNLNNVKTLKSEYIYIYKLLQ